MSSTEKKDSPSKEEKKESTITEQETPTPPKSTPPKPGSVKEKFCTLQVEPKLAAPLLDAFLFDVKERGFKKAEINHTFDIQDVVIPKEYENDYALARLHAKKKGKIKRKITLDGKEILATELDFEA